MAPLMMISLGVVVDTMTVTKFEAAIEVMVIITMILITQ
jgi:hypothetical protein